MEMRKKIGAALIINCLTLILLVIGIAAQFHPIVLLVVFVVIQTGSWLYVYSTALAPMTALEKVLNQSFEKPGDSEEILKSAPDNIIFVKKIKLLFEKYSNLKIRENLARMFDKQAELTALQSQINPHFLCNTLESIRGQALIDDNYEIAKMVEALAAFFRYSISRKGNLVTLRDELANIQNYMMIQRYRFNNRFSMEIIIDEEDEKAYDFLIPKLILQPVVENALFHGLEERLEGGKVEIEVIVTERNMILTVSDNGKGMDSKVLTELNNRIRSANQYVEDNRDGKGRSSGIALLNIHKRIQLLFGQEYGLNVYSTMNQGTDVEITIPANYDMKDQMMKDI